MTTDADAKHPPGWEGLLDPDERILWQGRPRPGLVVEGWQRADAIAGAFFVLFGMVWINLIGQLDLAEAPPAFAAFPLIGVLVAILGLLRIAGPVPWQSLLLTRTWYTLTDRRAFVAVDPPFGGKVLKTYWLDRENRVALIEGNPPSVQFDERRIYRRRQGRAPSKTNYRTERIAFWRIDDAEHVLALLHQVQAQGPHHTD